MNGSNVIGPLEEYLMLENSALDNLLTVANSELVNLKEELVVERMRREGADHGIEDLEEEVNAYRVEIGMLNLLVDTMISHCYKKPNGRSLCKEVVYEVLINGKHVICKHEGNDYISTC